MQKALITKQPRSLLLSTALERPLQLSTAPERPLKLSTAPERPQQPAAELGLCCRSRMRSCDWKLPGNSSHAFVDSCVLLGIAGSFGAFLMMFVVASERFRGPLCALLSQVGDVHDEGMLFLWVTGRAMELARECPQGAGKPEKIPKQNPKRSRTLQRKV